MKFELVGCATISDTAIINFIADVKANGEECNPLWEAQEIGVKAWKEKIGMLSRTDHEHYLAFLVDDYVTGVCRITPNPKNNANGQVGLYIRPNMRGKMYAPSFIRMIEEYCRKIGISYPTACCDMKNYRAVGVFKNANWMPTQKHYEWTGGRVAIELTPRI